MKITGIGNTNFKKANFGMAMDEKTKNCIMNSVRGRNAAKKEGIRIFPGETGRKLKKSVEAVIKQLDELTCPVKISQKASLPFDWSSLYMSAPAAADETKPLVKEIGQINQLWTERGRKNLLEIATQADKELSDPDGAFDELMEKLN